MVSVLRPMTDADHPEVLALNEAFVHLLAPLEEPRLRQLRAWADQDAVIELDGGFAGFVLTFAAGSPYDGDHFGWFAERYEDFHYLDRVVLAPHTRRRGLATAAYDELEAGCGRPAMCLEVNLDPPNEASLAFHRARGYREVGRRSSDGKLVVMLAKDLP